ncbi:VOC family protein [Mangrovibacterium marinum]|uniref:PhnB protein n=1 Tax=Mangrovibacterium marinum TaxID=1639118 RepID=A0A2T5C4M1_9BACT|nr:VOC family protein [Mangrovibacterium marinum]PTN09787.1 PhnB protein [Mangrovibacterium marinum]
MAKVSVYLNFNGQAEEAFEFYKEVFQTEYLDPIARFADVPEEEHLPELSEDDKNLVMHVSLPITGGFVLMGCDAPASMGMQAAVGNNIHLNLQPDSRDEADRLFNALAEGGTITMPQADMFWGAYYGSLTDKYGIHWMINCHC